MLTLCGEIGLFFVSRSDGWAKHCGLIFDVFFFVKKAVPIWAVLFCFDNFCYPCECVSFFQTNSETLLFCSVVTLEWQQQKKDGRLLEQGEKKRR